MKQITTLTELENAVLELLKNTTYRNLLVEQRKWQDDPMVVRICIYDFGEVDYNLSLEEPTATELINTLKGKIESTLTKQPEMTL